MISQIRGRRSWLQQRWRFGAILLLLCAPFLLPKQVSAHAFLDRSDPEANTVVSEAPAEVRLWFTEPLEAQYASASLYDVDGNQVETPASETGPDDNQLRLPLPDGLANGTYTVAWRNVSAADGHPNEGFLSFTVGTQADVRVPASPAPSDFGGPPTAFDAIGRWLGLLGGAGALGTLITWFWVIRPANSRLKATTRARMRTSAWALTLAGIGVALLGSIVSLVIQTDTVSSGVSGSAMLELIRNSQFGEYWLARFILLLILASVIGILQPWRAELTRDVRWMIVLIAGATLVPISLNSHASAVDPGQSAAVIADLAHLGAASVWIGGLLALVVVLITGTRGQPAETRRGLYASTIPRFSTLAISSVVVLILTGSYATWLQVGNLTALTETDHGRTLLIKLAMTIIMLMIGALNLLVLEPRMQRAARTGLLFGRTVAAEAILGIAILLLVGILTSLPTARGVIDAQANGTIFHFTEKGVHLTLYISPSAVGANRYTADFDLAGSDLPPETSVLLRTSTKDGSLGGVREVQLTSSGNNRFDANGTELSVTGDWQLEVILRRPKTADWRVTTPITIHNKPPDERVPGPAPRFIGSNGTLWTLIAITMIPIVIIGWRQKRSGFLVGASMVLLLTSGFGLLATEKTIPRDVNQNNPIPASSQSIAAGRQLFVANCVRCHGMEAKGDGPDLSGVNILNADLTASHTDAHTDGEFHWWILKGKSGTPMPSFETQLTDNDIWNLINYVRSLRHPAASASPPGQ